MSAPAVVDQASSPITTKRYPAAQLLGAESANGVLEITAPMATAAQPREIAVNALLEPVAKHVTA